MGRVWAAVVSIFNDPYENCYLNNNANLNEGDSFALYDYAWVACAIATILACGFSFYLIYKHCTNYTSKYQQRYIVRILLMVPIYALDSFLSFRLYNISIYFDLVRDTYEAFVINTFFCLLIEYTGGYRKTKETFAENERIKLIFPLNCVHVRPKRGMLRTLKRLTLQYVILRPLTTLIAVILQSLNLYCPGNWNFGRGYIYLTTCVFVSVTLAMYALIQFYDLTKKVMKPHKPIGKFVTVKFVIFMSFWQSIAIAGFVYIHVIRARAGSGWTTDNVSSGVQNVLICGEMLIVAIAHIFVFSYKPYVKEGISRPLLSTLAHVFNPFDVYKDLKYSFFPKKKKGNRKNSIKMKKGAAPPALAAKAGGAEGEKEVSNNDIILDYTTVDGATGGPPVVYAKPKKQAKYEAKLDLV